ncbi:hypothetical protein [Pseudarthrobacter sp. NCCP-2145]|uniref:hypothetical protein n=1 Tax=Pseudarthrobacter sp. NCCP-2145 TaxID=2942290 RepID=UPI0020418563|nr:hypothetical protein [Pseudarthrobacter sp. NCCP-2145]
MAGDPFRALCFKRFDLVLGGAVEFLARNVLVDLRGPLPVRTVRAAEVADVGFADGTIFLAVPAKGTGTCISPAGATIETPRCAVLAVTAAGTVAAVTERLPVLSPAETATVTFTVTARTVTEGLLVTIAIRLAVTVAEGLPLTTTAEGLAITVAKWLALTTTETTTIPFAVTTRTVTEGLLVTVTERLPLTTTETATVTLAIATRTITEGLLVTIAIRLAVTVTERLPLPAAETATVTLAIATRTITEGLAVSIAKRLSLASTGGTSGGLAAVAVATGAETPGVSA